MYQGPLIGAVVAGRPVKPLKATWPDRQGRFQLVLPRSVSGKQLTLFLDSRPRFSRAIASPGHAVDPGAWAKQLTPDMPRRMGSLKLP